MRTEGMAGSDDAAAGAPSDNGVERMRLRAAQVRERMGGEERIAALHDRGRLTAREHIEALVDDGTFREIGTFARSERAEDRDVTPGDGKVVGRATVDGRGVALVADDVTVKRASTSNVGARKVRRVYDLAMRDGVPLVHFGETGGARIPDIMGSEAFSMMQPPAYTGKRGRRVPLVTVITGESFGGSSFLAAASDLTIQIEGTCLAITSPRVFEAATGETLSLQELGGADVHARTTGQTELTAPDGPAAAALVRRFLSYLPSNAWTSPPRDEPIGAPAGDVGALVPADRRRAWDMRKLVRGVCDRESVLELMPMFGRSVLTMLARIDGRPVGVVASQPMQQAGVLGPDACDKVTRLVCLCDAFGLPLVFLQDTPGFMVGSQVEHSRLLHKATMMWQAVSLAGVAKLTVIVRKSYGVAHYAMGGIDMEGDLLCAWPGAEISFMDPATAANVLVSGSEEADLDERRARAREVALDVAPYGAAGAMRIDEIIAPASTRSVLAAALEDVAGRPFQPGCERPLSRWPNSW
ncbi:MAG: methylmalonyl-CoA decarboxylase subunit alpha [Solirubrobacteraceae bacterium]|jgi:acetyl-CoA carboxylase carboxyltransferase component|nr:methylmalonyl-CoA decarboxylase subunit alpha [Solirubrobacteraceae bacterium]